LCRGKSAPSPDQAELTLGKIPAYERIAALTRAAITAGRLAPGTVIRVGDVANVFGSSRSPVREAFRILQEEGSLLPHDGQGSMVAGSAQQELDPQRITPDRRTFGLDDDHADPEAKRIEALYYSLEHSLIIHSIAGGQRLNELAMARHFELDRRNIRALTLRAESTGLVERNGARWQIVAFDDTRCRNLYEMRILLEPLALRKAAEHMPRAELEAMYDRLAQAIADREAVQIADVDLLEADLHRRALSWCPNPEITEALRRAAPTYLCGKYIQNAVHAHRRGQSTRADDVDVVTHFLIDHIDIIDKMRHGYVDEACRALKAHLVKSVGQITGKLGDFLALSETPLPPPIFD